VREREKGDINGSLLGAAEDQDLKEVPDPLFAGPA
jgi:hypothetical protein